MAPIRGNKKINARILGLLMAVTGASLWGISGTVSSILFRNYDFPFTTLVTLRMIMAGVILLVVFRPAFPSFNKGMFFLYSVVGLFGVQITYLAAIYYSNAPTATLLQYLFFPMVIIYETVRGKIKFSHVSSLSMILVMFGTFELITGFPFQTTPIILNPYAIFFGLLSAFEGFLYIILSAPLINKNGTVSVVTWAFIIGGAFSLTFSLGQSYAYFSSLSFVLLPEVFSLVIFVAVFGTLIAFGLYIRSMKDIGASQASLAGTMEPIMAAVSSAFVLGIFLTDAQYLGGLLILFSIILMQVFSKRVFYFG